MCRAPSNLRISLPTSVLDSVAPWRAAYMIGAFALVASPMGWTLSAHASPWTLPQGRLVLTAGFNHQLANQEFLDDGPAQAFPLNGRYNASSFSLGIRVGFTDRIEFEATIPIRVVNYDADPVVLLEQPAGSPLSALDYFQQNVINLSRSVSGVSDFVIAGRYGWMRAPIALATEIRVKAPTGYQPPAGTFGERPTSREAFVSDLRRFVAPGNVEDDVTLGDGQLDLTVNMLAGWSLQSGTFLRLGAGYNLRLSDAGDQLVSDFRVGQLLGKRVVLYVGVRGALTIEDGRVIGVSVAAIDPELPAEQFGGTDNLLLREVTLDRDALDIGGGIIIQMSDRLELNAGYERTVLGRNTAEIQSFSVSLAFRAEMGS